jgi:hypothetical protein
MQRVASVQIKTAWYSRPLDCARSQRASSSWSHMLVGRRTNLVRLR